jgi:hypothetical protein
LLLAVGTNNGDNKALMALSADSSALLSAQEFGHSGINARAGPCRKARLVKM